MNRVLSAVVMTLIATCFCLGQSASSAAAMPAACIYAQAATAQQPSAANQQPAQSEIIPVQLTKSLDSRKLRLGDPIEAKVAVELRAGDGTVIARGSKVVGHVTQASARAKGDPESTLGIVFDQIALKDGRELPMKASIQAVGPPPNIDPAATELGNAAPVPSAGVPGPMGGAANPQGLGAPTTNFPPPSAGTQPPPPMQGSRQNVGELTAQSNGFVGLHGMQLEGASVLTSGGKEVKLEAGSQILLRVQNQ